MDADAASPDDLPVGIPGILDQRILDQSELWSDRYGRVHRITDMPNEYLRKVIGFLERRAREFARSESTSDPAWPSMRMRLKPGRGVRFSSGRSTGCAHVL